MGNKYLDKFWEVSQKIERGEMDYADARKALDELHPAGELRPYQKAEMVEDAFPRLRTMPPERQRQEFNELMASLDITDVALKRELWLSLQRG